MREVKIYHPDPPSIGIIYRMPKRNSDMLFRQNNEKYLFITELLGYDKIEFAIEK